MKISEQKKTDENRVLPQKNILIIKARDENALRFEIFLKNRGWNISTTTDLKKALANLLTQSVQYVMISVDHPSPKAKRLPAIIQKTINIPVILFSESTNQTGIAALRASAHPYILFPPVSGPSIERIINRIEKDLIKGDENLDGAIRVAGQIATEKGLVQPQKHYGLADLVHLFEGDGQADLNSAEEGEIESSIAPGSDFGSEDARNTEAQNQSLMAKDKKALHAGQDHQLKTSALPNDAFLNSPDFPSEARVTSFRSKGKNTDGSVFVMGVESALASTRVIGKAEDHEVIKVSKCSRVQCFGVKSEEFTGYIVVAYGAKHQDTKDFTSVLKNHLAGYLESKSIPMKISQMMDLKVTEVNFEDWSMKEATFLRKSVHQENEIVVSFFPSEENLAPVELSAEAHMCKINLAEVRNDVALEFDMYLYLPNNERYVLFTLKDDFIGETRHQRLIKGGVTDIHLRRESENDLSRYRVQNFLNDLILNYAVNISV